MKENISTIPHSDAENDTPPIFADRAFSFYWKLIRWPILTVALIDILALLEGGLYHVIIATTLFLFLFLGYQVKIQHSGTVREALFLGAISGYIIGFIFSFARFMVRPVVYLFFNILYEPFIFLIGGSLLAAVSFYLSSLTHKILRMISR